MKNALSNKSIILSIEKIIFHGEDNDGVVLSGKESNGKTRQVVGTLTDPRIGSIIKATGFWKRHDRYGWQFKAEDIAVLSQDPVNDPREALQCRITFVKELRQDTGFCSASGIMKDDSKVRLSGRLKNMSPGIEAYALGEWHEDEKYGREFRVKQWEYFKPERPGTLQKCLETISAIKASNDKTSKIHEFSWNEVEMKDDMVFPPGFTRVLQQDQVIPRRPPLRSAGIIRQQGLRDGAQRKCHEGRRDSDACHPYPEIRRDGAP